MVHTGVKITRKNKNVYKQTYNSKYIGNKVSNNLINTEKYIYSDVKGAFLSRKFLYFSYKVYHKLLIK